MTLGALFIFCICKRKKRNRRRKGKHAHFSITAGRSEIPVGPSLLESVQGRKGWGESEWQGWNWGFRVALLD